MKIILKEIKNNFRQNYFLIGALVTSIILCFMVIASNMIIENKREIEYHKKIIYTFEKPKSDTKKYIELSKDEDISKYNIFYNLPKSFSIPKEYKTEESISSQVMISKIEGKITDKGRLPELDSDELEIAVPRLYALVYKLELGDSIDFLGLKLKIVGFTNILSQNSFVTSISTMEKLNIDPNKIEIVLNENLKDTERRDKLKILEKEINPDNISYSSKGYRDTNEKMQLAVRILIILSTLSLIFIHTHVLNKRRKKYFIFRFNGMSRLQFYGLLLIEIVFIYLISFIISVALFYMYDLILMKQILGILRYDLKLSSILMVFVTYIVILIISIFISIRRYFNKSLAESYKEV